MTLIEDILYVNNYNLNYTERIDMSSGKRDVVLRESSACHNFFPFRAKDMLFAIGGQDNWKCEEQWKCHETFKEYKAYFSKRFGREYDRDAERWKKAQKRVIEECTSLEHSDGLYIFRSHDNGLTWETIKRIVTTDHPGFADGREWGKGAEFDGHLCCVWFKDKWFLFCRQNPSRGVRHIQYATSKDLLEWSEFKKCDLPYLGQQWYYPAVVNGKINKQEALIGQFPVVTDKKSSIKVFYSTDGVEWFYYHNIFEKKPFFFGKNPKPYYMPVQGTLNLFLENYQGLDKKNKVRVIKI